MHPERYVYLVVCNLAKCPVVHMPMIKHVEIRSVKEGMRVQIIFLALREIILFTLKTT